MEVTQFNWFLPAWKHLVEAYINKLLCCLHTPDTAVHGGCFVINEQKVKKNEATNRTEIYRLMKIITHTRDVIEFTRYSANGNMLQLVIIK